MKVKKIAFYICIMMCCIFILLIIAFWIFKLVRVPEFRLPGKPNRTEILHQQYGNFELDEDQTGALYGYFNSVQTVSGEYTHVNFDSTLPDEYFTLYFYANDRVLKQIYVYNGNKIFYFDPGIDYKVEENVEEYLKQLILDLS